MSDVKSTTITGIPSGDHESFCWDVTPAEFKRITGRKPDRWDRSYFNKGRVRLYEWDLPHEFKPTIDDNEGRDHVVSYQVTETNGTRSVVVSAKPIGKRRKK